LARLRRVIGRWGRAGCANPCSWGVLRHTRIESNPRSRRVRGFLALTCRRLRGEFANISSRDSICDFSADHLKKHKRLLHRGFSCIAYWAHVIRDDFDMLGSSNCVDLIMSDKRFYEKLKSSHRTISPNRILGNSWRYENFHLNVLATVQKI